MIVSQVVGVFPLVDVVLVTHVVVVVIKVSLADLNIEKSDASCKSSQILGFDVLLSQEIEHVGAFRIVELEDFGTGQFGVVAAVADWSRVVVRIRLVEEHDGI